MLTYFLFVLGFFLLIKSADWLVDGATSLARKYRISDLVIGLTIVAFGTSAPEFVVNLLAAAGGNTDLAIGNILGSNIANIFLILGLSALIYPLAAKRQTVMKEIPFSLIAVLIVWIIISEIFSPGAPAMISRYDGLILLLFFGYFLYYSFKNARLEPTASVTHNETQIFPRAKTFFMISFGLLGLTLGGHWIVTGAVKIAESFNLSQSLIGLTIVAIGTSLPELATSVTAAIKKQSDIAIGNVVGSNIFNLLWILGASSIIRPLPFADGSTIDLAVTALASIVLFSVMFIGKKQLIERWQGALMLITYFAYLTFSVLRQ